MCNFVVSNLKDEMFQAIRPTGLGLHNVLDALTGIGSLGLSLAVLPILWTENGQINLLSLIESTRIQLPKRNNFLSATWMDILVSEFNLKTVNVHINFNLLKNVI